MCDYLALKRKLILEYSKQCYSQINKYIDKNKHIFERLSSNDKQFIQSFANLTKFIERYENQQDLDLVLDTIDLSKIYQGADKRELDKSRDTNLYYEDFLVLELLDFFKNQFFKWINKPECSTCGKSGDNIIRTGTGTPQKHNPDEITIIEQYRCQACKTDVAFPRINNSVTLLSTRKGRCGEWVNCFMLILKALLGADLKIRYVWNKEDHVWCEYYSQSLKRWIHLDPCEAAFDEPNLYCDNWGKNMSWVIGVNNAYIIDLSNKYITNKDKVIPKSSTVSHVAIVNRAIKLIAYSQMKKFVKLYITAGELNDDDALRFYYNVLLPYKQETLIPTTSLNKPSKITSKGRQTGDSEWTKERGEDGK